MKIDVSYFYVEPVLNGLVCECEYMSFILFDGLTSEPRINKMSNGNVIEFKKWCLFSFDILIL